MKHVIAFIIKFLMIGIILEILFTFMTALAFTPILLIALAVTVLSYLIGDLLVLSKLNNMVATIVDIILAVIIIYAFNYVYVDGVISIVDALIGGIVIGIGEIFFHKYMAKTVFPNRD